jgi:hypothetical protein
MKMPTSEWGRVDTDGLRVLNIIRKTSPDKGL